MSEQIELRYRANPTAKRFHADRHQIHALVGPWGCGKSQAAIWDILQYCLRHPESDVLVIRDTYSALTDSCVTQFLRVLGNLGEIKWGPPPDFHWHPKTGLKGTVKFRAAEDPRDVQKFLSVDVGMAWLEEVTPGIQADGRRNQGLPPEIFAGVWARCRQIKDERRMVLTAAPPPSGRHWFFTVFYDKLPLLDMQKIQEMLAESDEHLELDWGAVLSQLRLWQLTPEENKQNLPAGYYASLLPLLKTPDQVKRFIQGEVGASYDGNPVYPAYADNLHRDSELRSLPGSLVRGWDGGLTPACVWAQLTPSGRLFVLAELQGTDEGIDTFADAAIAYGNQQFGERQYRDFGDETLRNGDQGSGKSAIDYLRAKQIRLRPVKNDIDPRVEGVRKWLGKLGSDGALLRIHPRCESIIEGFRGAYKFHEVGGVATDKPEKNAYSHLHDCLQYICVGLSIGSQEQKQAPLRPEQIDRLGQFTHPAHSIDRYRQKHRTHRGAN